MKGGRASPSYRRLGPAMVILLLLCALPLQMATAVTVTTFSNGKSAEILTFNSAGKSTVNVSVPDDSTVKKAGFDIDSQELALGQGYPTSIKVDVGSDGTTEWAFSDYANAGALGHQSLLESASGKGSVSFTTSTGGTDTTLKIMLPKFAKIKDGSLWVDGNGSAYEPLQTKVIKGTNMNEELGWSGANVGDMNNDGWDDLAVTAMGYAKVYLYYGGPNFDATPDMIFSGPFNRYFGHQVMGLGDVNGDTYDDMAISENGSRAVRVYYGGPNLDNQVDLNLTGLPAPITFYGYCIAGGSDLDGDGNKDIAVGDYYYDNTDEGRVYVYKGGPGIDNVSDYLLKLGSFIPLAHSMATGGDITGDGWDDLVVGDPDLGFSMGGKVYIYKGGPGFGGFPISMAVSLIRDDLFAWDMDIRNDVNGDGMDDLVVGAPDNGTGRVYIYWGRANWPGTAGPSITMFGEADGDFFGYSLATLGDMNGDKKSELLVGAPGFGQGKLIGKTYFINGSTNPQRAGAYTILGNQNNAYHGWWVEYLGNIANDGGRDFLVSDVGNNSNRGDVRIYRPVFGLGAPTLSLGPAKASGLEVTLLNGTRQATFAAADLQAALDQSIVSTTDKYGTQYALLTLTATTTGPGAMTIRGISINYTAKTAGLMPLKDAFNAYLAKTRTNGSTGQMVPVPITVSTASQGRLVLSNLNVEYSPNVAPTAIIDGVSPVVIDAGDAIVLSGHGTDDSKVVGFNWSSDKQGFLGSSSILTVNLTVVGEHTLSFKVQDDRGRWSAPVTAKVTVNKRDHPTEISIAGPAEGQKVSDIVTISGGYTDPDVGDAIVVEISIDGGGWMSADVVPINGTDGTWSYIWAAGNETEGDHTISARAYDGWIYSGVVLINVSVFHPIPGIGVSSSSVPVQAYPGDKVELRFTVSNPGTGPGVFTLKTSTDPYERVEMTTPTITLGPGNSTIVKVFVIVDKNTKPPEDISVGLRAALVDDPEIASTGTMKIHVVAKPPNPADQAVSIEAPEGQSGKRGAELTYVFKVTNKGTASDSYELSATSKDGWTVAMTVGGAVVTGPLKLDAGGRSDVTVTVLIPPKAKGGTSSDVVFTVRSTNFPLVNSSAKVTTKVEAQPVKKPVINQPYILPAIAVTVIMVCAVAGIVLGTEWGTFGLFWLLIPLYSRLKKEAVLDNFKRGEINAFIRLNPGTYYNEIKKHLDVSNGVLTYHLNRLEFEGYVKSKVNGRYKHYFPADMKIPTRIITLNEMQRALLKFIRDKHWVTQAQISESLDIPVPTVSRHLNRLQDAEMVTVEKRGNLNYYGIRGDWAGPERPEERSVSAYDAVETPDRPYRPDDQATYQQYDSNYPNGYQASDGREEPPFYQQ